MSKYHARVVAGCDIGEINCGEHLSEESAIARMEKEVAFLYKGKCPRILEKYPTKSLPGDGKNNLYCYFFIRPDGGEEKPPYVYGVPEEDAE